MSNTAFLLLTLALLAGWFAFFGLSGSAASIALLFLVGSSILFVLDFQARRGTRA